MAAVKIPIPREAMTIGSLDNLQGRVFLDESLTLFKELGLNVQVECHMIDEKGLSSPVIEFIKPEKLTWAMAVMSLSEYLVFENDNDALIFKLSLE